MKLPTSWLKLGSGVSSFSGTGTGVAMSAPCQPPDVPFVLLVGEMSPDLYHLAMRAEAIVSNSKSLISHLAILSRSNQIPTVMGVETLQFGPTRFGDNRVLHGEHSLRVSWSEVYLGE